MTHATAAGACQMRIAGGARTIGGSRTIAAEAVTGDICRRDVGAHWVGCPWP
jgi:hypothetical protein